MGDIDHALYPVGDGLVSQIRHAEFSHNVLNVGSQRRDDGARRQGAGNPIDQFTVFDEGRDVSADFPVRFCDLFLVDTQEFEYERAIDFTDVIDMTDMDMHLRTHHMGGFFVDLNNDHLGIAFNQKIIEYAEILLVHLSNRITGFMVSPFSLSATA